ncbi:MAG: DUF308 domain-containing protein [Caldilineaceae bacterium]|jgi:uncharacterized membrane protein HdeD (DUF308 family)
MAAQDNQSFTDSVKQESLDTAKGLAPWRAGLAWWIVLIEGIALAVIGILILINPRQAVVNVALLLAAALVVAGILQIWAIMQGRVPESSDALLAARAGIGIFAGGIVLLLFFLEYLGTESGLITFGLGSLVYGVLGIWATVTSSTRRTVSSIIDGVFFTLFGVLLIYVLYAGSQDVEQVTVILAWTAIVGGLLLIALSFYSRYRQQRAAQKSETVYDSITAGSMPVDEASQANDARETQEATDMSMDASASPGNGDNNQSKI